MIKLGMAKFMPLNLNQNLPSPKCMNILCKVMCAKAEGWEALETAALRITVESLKFKFPLIPVKCNLWAAVCVLFYSPGSLRSRAGIRFKQEYLLFAECRLPSTEK